MSSQLSPTTITKPHQMSMHHLSQVQDQEPSSCSTSPSLEHITRTRPPFSQGAVKILRRWFATHRSHPYPNQQEKENLCDLTGLSISQISNWFANVRRRSKSSATAFVSSTRNENENTPSAIDIPSRPPTPGIFADLSPLQRWANSPPEDEHATISAISRAISVLSSSDVSRDHGFSRLSDDNSAASLSTWSSESGWHDMSSEGSLNSGRSSSAGAHSATYALRSNSRRRRRRRRTKTPHHRQRESHPESGRRPFQCTFCTEAFKTKYDWQRHEKTWHLSLDRWVCSPAGPVSVDPATGASTCIFCDAVSPDQAHLETHNFAMCRTREQEERTFYRKDHLTQHLRLVHYATMSTVALDSWKVLAPPIRSRCGFCGCDLDDWPMRVDHIGDHFKKGSTMAEWVGDWGFDDAILQTVENSLPPCM